MKEIELEESDVSESDEEVEVLLTVEDAEAATSVQEFPDQSVFLKVFENEVTIFDRIFNKGNISTFVTFVLFMIGITIRIATWLIFDDLDCDGWIFRCNNVLYIVGDVILSIGLFGFSGGVTNWLAIKMLFDRIPLLFGSGVIPKRFVEIRETIKRVIMDTFFEEEFLQSYVKQKAGQLVTEINFEEKIHDFLESPTIDSIIDEKLKDLASRPEGMWLTMVKVNPSNLKPMIKPLILSMGSEVAPIIVNSLDAGQFLSIEKVREEVDSLLTKRLEELTAPIVKKLMEDVIRKHLGWLVVWGNIFGAVMGVLARLAGF